MRHWGSRMYGHAVRPKRKRLTDGEIRAHVFAVVVLLIIACALIAGCALVGAGLGSALVEPAVEGTVKGLVEGLKEEPKQP